MEGEGEGASATPGGAAALLFLPDGSVFPVPLDPPPGPTAAEILRRLQGALRLPPPAERALALWMSSPLLEVQLTPQQRPRGLFRRWPLLLLRLSLGTPRQIHRDEPCLQLRRNLFFPKSQELELEQEELLRLLYEDSRGQFLGGRFPIDPQEGAELGGLLCRLRLGPFRPGHHSPHGLRPLLGELLPPSGGGGGLWGALRRRGAPPPEEGLFRAFARAPGPHLPPPELHRRFLRRCQRLPGYGCAFFPGAIERPPGGLLGRGGLRPVSVAVGLEGVTIIDPRHKQVLLTLTYPELCWELVGAVGQEVGGGRGAAMGQEEGGGEAAMGQELGGEEPPQLWLEFDGDHEGAPVNRLLRIFSPQAELMSALIERCIELGGAAPPPEAAAQAPPPEEAAQAPPPEEAAQAPPPEEAAQAPPPEEAAQAPPPEEAAQAPPPEEAAQAPPPEAAAQAPPPRREERGVTRPRPQRLATIDYVREGQELRRVKPPRRSASFFGRGGGSSHPGG